MNARRWLLPSFSVMLWLVVFLNLCFSDWRLVMINADGDPSLHRRLGNWMIEHRAVLRADEFSHTRFGAPLISKEWLGEVLFAAAENRLGWNGAVLVAALLIATTLWLLHRWLLAEGCELLLATGLVLLAGLASSHHWLARPHLVTHLLTVVFAWQLRAFDRNPNARPVWLFMWLVPLMALWANLHGAFFTGFLLLGIYAAGNLTQPRKLATLVAVSAACLAASFINPNGWHLHEHILQFLRDPLLAKFTNEFRSPDFHSGAMHGFLLQLLALAAVLLVARPRLRATDTLLVGVCGVLALQMVRNVPIFAIVITPILAEHWQAVLTKARSGGLLAIYHRFSTNVTRLSCSADGRATAMLALVAVVAIMAKPQAVGSKPILVTEIMTNRFPVAAVQFLQQNPAVIHGEMFNDYGWGGYLELALTDHKVFVDGRNDFFGPTLIKEFDTVNRVQPGWDADLQKYNVGWTILPRAHPLNQLLALHKDWSLSYTDDVTTIYSRLTN